jgi:hypothetical protein
MSVVAEPMDEGVSLSGVQPKVAVIKDADRYVGRTKLGRTNHQDSHIIAKLPVVGQPMLPELEHLSLQLAACAGVRACDTYLKALEKLAMRHGYDLGDANGKTNFLAVLRYDREPGKRIHCEDFAQILGEMPEDKYGGRLAKADFPPRAVHAPRRPTCAWTGCTARWRAARRRSGKPDRWASYQDDLRSPGFQNKNKLFPICVFAERGAKPIFCEQRKREGGAKT